MQQKPEMLFKNSEPQTNQDMHFFCLCKRRLYNGIAYLGFEIRIIWYLISISPLLLSKAGHENVIQPKYVVVSAYFIAEIL